MPRTPSIDPSTPVRGLELYLGFDDESSVALQALYPRAAPELDTLADEVCRTLAVQTETAAPLPSRQAIRAWLESLLRGPHDQAHFDASERLGRDLLAIGIPQALLIAAVNHARIGLGRIARAGAADAARGEPALHAILDLELAVMLEAYRAELTARSRRAERLATTGELATSISHELRAPLAVIESSVFLVKQVLSETGAPPANVSKHLDRIASQVRGSRRRIDDLLELARERPPHRTRVQIRALVEAAVEAAHLPSGVAIDLSVPPDLYADLDWNGIRQVLVALLANASEAMKGVGHVSVQAAADEEGLQLLVYDDGPGVPAALHGRIFDALFSTRPDGTGLGLTVSRRILDSHGGRIALEPTDRGASFAVTVRRAH